MARLTTEEMASGDTPLIELDDFEKKIRYGLRQLSKRIGEYRAETGFDGRITPVLVTMGFIPLDSMIWELIHHGIRDTGLMDDLKVDLPIMTDPVGWECLCAAVRSGHDARKIFELRLTRTDWKTGDFKAFLYQAVFKQTGEPPHKELLSLFENIVDRITQNFRSGSLRSTKLIGAWKEVFPSLSALT